MTKLMGILNTTPDSFFDQGKFYGLEKALEHGISLFQDGADIIDVGGQSSRPGAKLISTEEELSRVIPVIKELTKTISIPISIDTMNPAVANEAIEAGASIINDITGLQNPRMRELVAESHVKVCVMHMQGLPETMQANPQYPEGVINHLLSWFNQRIDLLLESGIEKNNIILDPGIGFGKTVADNLEILNNLQKFKDLGFPVLLGASRKSFMSKILNKKADELLPSTIVVNVIAILANVDIIRVHDVREHRIVIDFMERYCANASKTVDGILGTRS